jgi:hypothetical protein
MEYYEAIETLAELMIHQIAEMEEVTEEAIEAAAEELKQDVKEMVRNILRD